MFPLTWRNWLQRWSQPSGRDSRRGRRKPHTQRLRRLALERLEDRTLLSAAAGSSLYGMGLVAPTTQAATQNTLAVLSTSATTTSASSAAAASDPADMSVTKTGPDTITAGTNATYTITLTNNGPDPADGVVLTDDIGSVPGIGFSASIEAAPGNPDSFTPGLGLIENATGPIAAGHVNVFFVSFNPNSNAPNGSTVTDTATVTATTPDPNPANNTSAVTSTIVTSADMSVTKTGPATITAGATATYTITLTNNGPSDSHGVTLTDALPAGETLVSEKQLSGPDSFTNTSSGNTASFTTIASTLPFSGSGTSGTISIPPGSVPWSVQNDTSNTSQDSWGIPGLFQGTATWPGLQSANFFTVTFTNLPTGVFINPLPAPPAGDSTQFQDSTSQTDWGGTISPDGLTVTFTAPAGLPLNPGDSFFVSAVFTGHVDPSGVSFTGEFQSDVGMPSGNTDTFQVVAQIASSQANGSSLTNTATVTATTPDPVPANNSSAVTSMVATAADMSVTKTGPATVTAGTTVTYTLTVTDNGPSDAQNVTVSDVLPNGLTLLSETPLSNPDGFTDTSTGNTPRFTATTVVASSTDTFEVVAFAPSNLANGTPLSDTAQVTSSTFDPDLSNNTSVFGSTVTAVASLTVTKTGPATVTAGNTATYTITITNNGPSDAANVMLIDALPATVVLASEQQVGGTDAFVDNSTGNTATFIAATMVAGNFDVFRVVVAVPSSTLANSDFNDTAEVTWSGHPIPIFSSVTTTVVTAANLAVVKTGPSTITAGTSVTYTLSVTNNGPSDAQTVTLTDALPPDLTRFSERQIGGTDSWTDNSTGNTAAFSINTLTAGHSDVFEVVASTLPSLPAGNMITDTANLSSVTPPATTVSSSFTSTVAAVADLSVVKEGPLAITAGTTITYTILATNHGPSDAQGVTLSDTLPAGFTLVSLTAVNTNPDKFTPAGALSVMATTMAAGNTDVFQVVAFAASNLAPNTGATDTATITSTTTDPNTNNNTSASTANIVTAADIAVAKTGPATILAGTNITYIITLTNNGPSDAQSVVLTDALPANVTLLAESQLTGPDAFVNATAGNVPRFTAVAVAAGHSDTFGVVGLVASNVPASTVLTNTATGSSATFDPTPANNTAVVNTTVSTQAALAVAKTGPTTATEGDMLTYTLAVANTGPSDAVAVVLADALPAGEAFVGGSVGGVGGTLSGNTVTFALGTLAPGQSLSGTVVVTASEDGAQTDTATVSSATTNANAANNTASVTTVVSEPVLSLNTFSFSTTEFQALNNATVATFVHANGVEPAGAFNVTINWGDGTTTGGTVVPQGTGYAVQGTHTYNVEGDHTLTVSVSDDSVSASAAGTVSVAEGGAPAGTSSVFQGDFIFETIDDIFSQALSLQQVQNLGLALLALEMSAMAQLQHQGDGLVQALATAFTMGQMELPLFATVLHNSGTTLESAVGDMTAGMLAQSLTEPLGLGG
jgi:uncharacterized repeat protein (TIGR01451 family)